MPLPTDQKLIALGEELLKEFDIVFGHHPGFRPVHAKGMLLTGAFLPSPEAASLTRAPHITRESTPITMRFSNATGIPLIPDNDPNANPHGCGIRFHLAEHEHTDIISHSYRRIPSEDGAGVSGAFARGRSGQSIKIFTVSHRGVPWGASRGLHCRRTVLQDALGESFADRARSRAERRGRRRHLAKLVSSCSVLVFDAGHRSRSFVVRTSILAMS